jgi:hypothetical protein
MIGILDPDETRCARLIPTIVGIRGERFARIVGMRRRSEATESHPPAIYPPVTHADDHR